MKMCVCVCILEASEYYIYIRACIYKCTSNKTIVFQTISIRCYGWPASTAPAMKNKNVPNKARMHHIHI